MFLRRAVIMSCVFLLVGYVQIANAVTCDANQYVNGDFCYTCPANATCDGINFTCNDGWFLDGAVCTRCSVTNATCTGPDDYSCIPGYYDNNGMCNACPENASCAGGHEYFHCNPGWYKKGTGCLSCDGHVCDGEVIKSCGPGYWLNRYGGYCIPCDTDQEYCPGGTDRRICNVGWYQDGNKNCRPCPTGYYCPLDCAAEHMHDHCAAGYYRSGNSCTKCDDGVVCPGGILDEMTCPDGLFKHDNGMCLDYDQDDCGIAPNCNPGCWNDGGECVKCSVENATCTDGDNFTCMAGYYDNGASCEICPENSDCPTGSTQISCLPGYWLDGNECPQCGQNPVYCINNTKYDCPEYVPGSLKPYLPSGHEVIFTSGYQGIDRPTQSSPEMCVISYMQISAPQGLYEKKWTYWREETNAYSKFGKSYWYAANAGYYLSDYTIINSEEFYLNVNTCTNGVNNSYYTGPGSPDGNDCPWVCNDGFYRDGDACLTCPDGMECVGGGVVCPIGMYADKNQCLPCPNGYTDATDDGAQSIKFCVKKCAGGTYIASAESNTCENVGAGYWIGENYTAWGAVGTRNMCNGGMTTLGYGTGADEADDCGRTLRVGDAIVHLRSGRQTTPSLVVQFENQKFYGNMDQNISGRIKIRVGDATYSVYDDSMTAAN